MPGTHFFSRFSTWCHELYATIVVPGWQRCVCVCVCVCVYMYVCVRIFMHTHTHTHVYTHFYTCSYTDVATNCTTIVVAGMAKRVPTFQNVAPTRLCSNSNLPRTLLCSCNVYRTFEKKKQFFLTRVPVMCI